MKTLEIRYDYHGEIISEKFSEEQFGDVAKFCKDFDVQKSLARFGVKYDLWFPEKITAILHEETIITGYPVPTKTKPQPLETYTVTSSISR